MRVLCYSILAPKPPGPDLRAHPDLQLTGVHPSSVDCGDFGSAQPDASAYDARYPIRLLPVFPRSPYPYALFLRGLSAVLREVRPEVLSVHGEPSELAAAQVVAAVRRIVPDCGIVLHSFENVPRDWSGFPKVLRGRAERATLPRIDLVRAFNEGVREVLAARGFPAERVRVVPLSVDPAVFHPQPADELRATLSPHGKLLIGYVGRLVPEKGIDLLLRAVAEHSDALALCIVGSGCAEDELRALASSLPGLEVRWIPHVPSAEVAHYLSAFDAMVLPSRGIPTWQEQFGRVLIEAMACGTPVVGSSSGAIPEVIGDAGLIFQDEDHRSLAGTLARLSADEALRVELAERGLTLAHNRYAPAREIEATVELFREARELSAHRRG